MTCCAVDDALRTGTVIVTSAALDVGQLRQHGVDARVAEHRRAGRAQPDVVPDAGRPVADRRHPVPARRRDVASASSANMLAAGVHEGLAGRALVAGAAGERDRRDLHRERLVAGAVQRRRDVEGGAAEGMRQRADAGAVEPDVGLVVDAVELQPDVPARAGVQAGRDGERPPVPPGVPGQRLRDAPCCSCRTPGPGGGPARPATPAPCPAPSPAPSCRCRPTGRTAPRRPGSVAQSSIVSTQPDSTGTVPSRGHASAAAGCGAAHGQFVQPSRGRPTGHSRCRTPGSR